MRIVGIGGTGVVTLAQVIATAAAIEGLHVRALDQTGLAQKGGAVVSDLSLRREPWDGSPRLAYGQCDLYLAADLIAGTEQANLRVADPARTVAVASTNLAPTGAMVTDVTRASRRRPPSCWPSCASAAHETRGIDALALAVSLLGDEQYANVLLLGAAYQLGAFPIAAATIEMAIRLNGTAVEQNIAAFRHGRAVVANPPAPKDNGPQTLDALISQPRPPTWSPTRAAAYARRYTRRGRAGARRETELLGS